MRIAGQLPVDCYVYSLCGNSISPTCWVQRVALLLYLDMHKC